ncbi:molybdenum cofactor guanylyltransferase [Halorussus lipolyticus]|uniref:molybdenum cofactor guanylyltransferase n=1 Tax=Halorussus lipolyticus TaxID=3034024 RepID=UPI0023E866E9|nr:molybdenum cofactor guanylyltransferase [Halorussus sp. DT80]
MTRDFETEERRTDELTGVVLAGGYSRRFGDEDKALADLGGRPLLGRVVARLAEVADRVVVNCRADQRRRFERALAPESAAVSASVGFAEDPVPDRGPLFGFRTALAEVETEACALAACDAPFLDPRLVADLAGRLVEDETAQAVALRTGGRPHPTQAVYRTAPAESACESLIDAGESRLSALLDRLATRPVSAEEVAGNPARSVFDVDTSADRERAEAMLDPNSAIGLGELVAPR